MSNNFMTSDEFRRRMENKIRSEKLAREVAADTKKILTEADQKAEKRAMLRAMGRYFDLPEKSVEFYIKQIEAHL